MAKKYRSSRIPPKRLKPEQVRAPTPVHEDETDDDLEGALEQTFPASDPIAFQSTLVPGRHR